MKHSWQKEQLLIYTFHQNKLTVFKDNRILLIIIHIKVMFGLWAWFWFKQGYRNIKINAIEINSLEFIGKHFNLILIDSNKFIHNLLDVWLNVCYKDNKRIGQIGFSYHRNFIKNNLDSKIMIGRLVLALLVIQINKKFISKSYTKSLWDRVLNTLHLQFQSIPH